MSNLFRSFGKTKSAQQPIQPGMYHYQAPQNDPRNYRLHLRVEQDGSGVMIVNAATVLHLNQSATEYAYFFIQNQPAETVARAMSKRYQVSKQQAFDDYLAFADRVMTLVQTPDLDPVTFLDFERRLPHSGKMSAPYRLDLAITYRLPAVEDPESAPLKRVDHELSTQEWKTIIDSAWQAGVPHLIFTGGEPTMREDLAELIAYAERNGQVSGLLSDGLLFADQVYLDSLLKTGLDHIMIVFQADNEYAWKALDNCIAADIFVAIHLTLSEENAEGMAALLAKLAEHGLKAISLSTSQAELSEPLGKLRDLAAAYEMELVWDLPVPYSAYNPVWLEVQAHDPTAIGKRAVLYVEPDGDVLPTQGDNRPLGNALRDSWGNLWKQKLALP